VPLGSNLESPRGQGFRVAPVQTLLDLVDGGSRDTQGRRNLCRAIACSQTIRDGDVVPGGASGKFPTLVLAGRLGPCDALALTLEHHFAFPLGGRSQHVEHQLPGWRRAIQVHREDAQGHSLAFDPINDPDQIRHRARKAVELVDDEHIAIADVVERRFELVACRDRRNLLAVDFLGARSLDIPDLGAKAGLLLNSRGLDLPHDQGHGCPLAFNDNANAVIRRVSGCNHRSCGASFCVRADRPTRPCTRNVRRFRSGPIVGWALPWPASSASMTKGE